MQDYKDEKYSQTVIFLSLCSQKDQDFIKMPRSALTIDDYARLIVIAKVLHFPLIAVRVIAKAEQARRADEVLNRLYELRADGTTTKRWIIDFAKAVPRSNIFFPELQTLLKEYRHTRKLSTNAPSILQNLSKKSDDIQTVACNSDADMIH